MPTLSTGAIALEAGGSLEANVVSHHVGSALEIVRLDVLAPDCDGTRYTTSIRVALGGERARGHGVVRDKTGAYRHLDILVARPRDQVGAPLAGEAFFTPGACRGAGVRYEFRATATATAARNDPQLPIAWASELSERMTGGDAWHAFAKHRLQQISGKPAPERAVAPTYDPDPLAHLMELTTGVDALQQALQSDRGLLLAARKTKPSIDIATLPGPALSSHPWAQMAKALGKPVPAEALAAATPAEFYYLRFASLPALFRVLDEVEAWASPIATLMDGRSEQRDLATRYQTQLGLERTAIARALGDKVVAEIAVVGSDPYVSEGSDVTMLFRVTSKPLFEATLAAALHNHGAAHGGITTSAVTHHGIAIQAARTADGAVQQYRAQLGAIEVVSNSLGAMRRVIDAHGGGGPRLSAEPDFQYMLARGADVPGDVLAFIGDRFVGEVVGPRQKILEARRQIALAELSTPAYAALLYGRIYGQSPRSTDELIASGLLARDDLAHGDGAAIAWRPDDAPRSSWGSPGALTPLIDLPAVDKVSPAEREAYARFASSYDSYWKTYIDPIAIRIAIAKDKITVDMRVLPLIGQSEYYRLLMLVGKTHITVPPIASGARAVIGLGSSAIAQATSGLGFFMRDRADLQWIGAWAAIGVDEHTQIAAAIATHGDIPQKPDAGMYRDRDRSLLVGLPVYAMLGVRDRAAAALFFVGLRKLADETAPGVLTWGESGRVGDVAIVKVAAQDDSMLGLTLYYAFAKDALVVSLDEHTVRAQIEAVHAGRGPARASPEGSGAQLVLDGASAKGAPLWRAAAWLLEAPARKAADRSAATAEALLFGAPHIAGNPARAHELALRTFGAVPMTADGRAFELVPEGVHDPVRGSRFAPAWPALPVDGSPIARVLAAIAGARGEISFDDEQGGGKEPAQSLHLRLTLGTR
jgi:hypothetical protein